MKLSSTAWSHLARRVAEDSGILLSGLGGLRAVVGPHAVDGVIASAALTGTISSTVFLVLFAAGLFVRIGRSLANRGEKLRGHDRARISSRAHAAEVPVSRRRRAKDDDPALPLR